MKRSVIIVLLSISFVISGFAQNPVTDARLASEYYQNKEYVKAADLYLKLFESVGSPSYFDYYIRCLLLLKDYETAEKSIKKQQRNNPSDFTLAVKLGNLYKVQNNLPKAITYYTNAIDRLPSNYAAGIRLAQEFISIREYDFAEKVYLKLREVLPGNMFRYEMANIKAYMRDFAGMIDEFLNAIVDDPISVDEVQMRLQYYTVNNIDGTFNDMLRTALLKKVQAKYNVETSNAFTEMLYWFYLQQGNYDLAFVQAKALDIRNFNEGQLIVDLGVLAKKAEMFQTAEACFDYVIKTHPAGTNLIRAKFELLSTLYAKTLAGKTVESEVISLEERYVATISELGLSVRTFNLLRELAYLQAYKLNKADNAKLLLKQAQEIKGLPVSLINACRMDLADILVFTGEVYDAILLFARVENENKELEIGYEAKFKKAKTAWYTGDFPWAESQLKVLQGSTSKLISNDALELALIISENMNYDSVELALKSYARADLLVQRNLYKEAWIILDSIEIRYNTSSIIDEVIWLRAQIKFKEQKYTEAIPFLENLANNFRYEVLADNAIFQLAEIYEFKHKDLEKAQAHYLDIMTNYRDSWFVTQARDQYRILRGDSL